MAPRLLGFGAIAGFAGVIVAGMAMPLVGSAGLATRNSIESYEQLPKEFRTPALPERTRVYSADGVKIATVFDQNRVEVKLKNIAPIMQKAVVAIEDSRFYEHNGIDPRGIVRATFTNLAAGGVAQGSSTLTMQYVKNVLVSSATSDAGVAAAREDTISRKLREMRYAMALEKKLTKSQILTRYLNIAYYGSKAYGVEAASQRYFSKHASDLTLVEAATLAGIVQQPSRFDPTVNPKACQERRDVVLNRMAELGYITDKQARKAKKQSVESTLNTQVMYNGCTTSYAPFFCDYALRMVKASTALGKTEKAREKAWRAGGYKIYTTLNMKAQKAATNAVMNAIPPTDSSKKAVAISMIEPGTGNIEAMAQNRTWGLSGDGKTSYNYNVNYRDGGTNGMQAGSTFKIFTIVSALDRGISPYTIINSPEKRTFTGFRECGNDATFAPYDVKNSTSSGAYDMFRGAAYSVNTYFVALEQRAGLCHTVDIAEKMGMTLANGAELPRFPSFTLGSMEVSPLSMAGAYATVAAHGQYCKPRAITKIIDRHGKPLAVAAPKCKQAVSRAVADAAAAVLSNVVDGNISGRTGGPMSLGRDAIGKTGTTNTHAAVWFAGATPDLAAAVWVGDPRGGFRHPLKNIYINGTYYRDVFGSSLPGPTWKAAMKAALAGSPAVKFDLKAKFGLQPARQVGTPAQRGSTLLPGQKAKEAASTQTGTRSGSQAATRSGTTNTTGQASTPQKQTSTGTGQTPKTTGTTLITP
ncbi:MAG: transglycosylase domain-containing protein [Candidatus Nanopelagicales bacterium]